MTQMTEEERAYYQQTRRSIFKTPESTLGRVGCGVGLVLWFALLLTPCALFYMAMYGQITIHHANIPEPEAHPLVQVQLVMEPDNRGLRVTTSQSQSASEHDMCVQTDVRYLLWQSESDESQNVSFCDCYIRDDEDADWAFTEQTGGSCRGE